MPEERSQQKGRLDIERAIERIEWMHYLGTKSFPHGYGIDNDCELCNAEIEVRDTLLAARRLEEQLENVAVSHYDGGWADGRKEGLEAAEGERLQLRQAFYKMQEERDALVEQLESAQTALRDIAETARWYADNPARLVHEVDHALCVEILDRAERAVGHSSSRDQCATCENEARPGLLLCQACADASTPAGSPKDES